MYIHQAISQIVETGIQIEQRSELLSRIIAERDSVSQDTQKAMAGANIPAGKRVACGGHLIYWDADGLHVEDLPTYEAIPKSLIVSRGSSQMEDVT